MKFNHMETALLLAAVRKAQRDIDGFLDLARDHHLQDIPGGGNLDGQAVGSMLDALCEKINVAGEDPDGERVEAAMECARRLLDANINGLVNEGEMDWDDVDNATAAAIDAIPDHPHSLMCNRRIISPDIDAEAVFQTDDPELSAHNGEPVQVLGISGTGCEILFEDENSAVVPFETLKHPSEPQNTPR